MHLSARRDSHDPIGAMGYALQDIPDTKDCSFPPGPRTLLGPTEMASDLVMFFRRKRENLSGFSDESRTHASGSDVDRQQEVLLHETGCATNNLLSMRKFNTPGRSLGEFKICSPSSGAD
jgi:hypothetical protein